MAFLNESLHKQICARPKNTGEKKKKNTFPSAGFFVEAQAPAPPQNAVGGFLKLGVPFLGVSIIRTIIFWGLNWGPLILGNYQLRKEVNCFGPGLKSEVLAVNIPHPRSSFRTGLFCTSGGLEAHISRSRNRVGETPNLEPHKS